LVKAQTKKRQTRIEMIKKRFLAYMIDFAISVILIILISMLIGEKK